MVEFLIIEPFVTLDSPKISDTNIVESATLESSSVELSIVDPVTVEFSKIALSVFEAVIFEKVDAQEVMARLTLIINKTKRIFFIFCSISNDKDKVCEDSFSLPAL